MQAVQKYCCNFFSVSAHCPPHPSVDALKNMILTYTEDFSCKEKDQPKFARFFRLNFFSLKLADFYDKFQ